MKKYIVTSLVLMSFAGVALAQVGVNARATTSVKVRNATTFEARVEAKAEFKAEVIKRKALNVAQVFNRVIEKLENILKRVESRIAKVKAEGGVTTESEGFVAEAKTHLSEARAKVAVFASLDLRDIKLRDDFNKLREASAEVKVHIKAAHTSLMNAVRSLRK